MALSSIEMKNLETVCHKLETGRDYRCDDYIENLLNTALDFQMKSTAVERATKYFKANNNIKNHQELKELLSKYTNDKLGNTKLAHKMWKYDHWTRAAFLRQLVKCFDKRGIFDQQSLKQWFTDADFKKDVKGKFKSKNHSIGPALYYWILLRVGVDTVKPDVHIKQFVSGAIGRRMSDQEVVSALVAISHGLPKQKGEAHRLDAAIWQHEKDRASAGHGLLPPARSSAK